jgi:hypothetical protein
MITFTLLGKKGKNPAIWYDVAGYITTISELATIFNVNHNTLRQRLRYGWSIEAACQVSNTLKLNFNEVAMLIQDDSLAPTFLTRLESYFGRPSTYTLGVK